MAWSRSLGSAPSGWAVGSIHPLLSTGSRLRGVGEGAKLHSCCWRPLHIAQRGAHRGLAWMAWAQLAGRSGQATLRAEAAGSPGVKEGARGQKVEESNKKDGWFIEGLVQKLIKIQTGMKFSLVASLSSRKTSEWPPGRERRCPQAGSTGHWAQMAGLGGFLALVLQSTCPSSSSWPPAGPRLQSHRIPVFLGDGKALKAAEETWA